MKLFSLVLIILVNFIACCPTGDCNAKQRYSGFSTCDFSSIVKDKNQTLYIVANREEGIFDSNYFYKKEKLYKLNKNNFLISDKKLEDLSLNYILELNSTTLPSAKEVTKLIGEKYSNGYIHYFKLFDLSQTQSPYLSAVVIPDQYKSLGYIVLFEKNGASLVLYDKVKYDYLYFNAINIDSAFYIENVKYEVDKWGMAIFDKVKKREFIAYENKKIVFVDLKNFIDNYYYGGIDYSEVCKLIQKDTPHDNGINQINANIRFSVYSEGLHLSFSSKYEIKNKDIKRSRAMAPLPEGVYQPIYRFYPRDGEFIDINLPIEANCTKNF